MRVVRWAWLVAVTASLGCAGGGGRPLPVAANSQLVVKRGLDPRVGTYVSTPWGFSTSSYWLEGPEGLILIDTQFLLSAADEFVDLAERVTGKKARLAIVLHANPDKFNGTGVLQRRGIRVVTSDQVRALLPGVHQKRVKAFHARYQPDYPQDLVLPEGFGAQTTELSAGGITVKAHVLGPGCSEAHVAVEFDGHLFVGDLVASGSHSWLELGLTEEWLARVSELQALKPRQVHPGRGPTGGPELLEGQRHYLQTVQRIVAESESLEAARTRVQETFPGLGFGVFLNLGLPAVWRRHAQSPAG